MDRTRHPLSQDDHLHRKFAAARYALTLLGLALGVILATAARGGDLLDATESIQHGQRKPEPERRRRHQHHHHDDCHENSFDRMLADIFGPPILWTLTLPWWGPHYAVQDNFAYEADFPAFPYQGQHPGYLMIDSGLPAGVDGWGGRFAIDYGSDLDDLQRIGSRLLIENRSRFGFDAEFNHWIERVPSGTDTANSGDLNLIYRFAQNERIQLYTGVGVNWFEQSGRGDAGVNFTYGVDVFPAKPLILRTVFDVGTIGDTNRFHVRSSIGWQVDRFEFFTGYDYQQFGTKPLQGLFTGLNIWF